MSRSGSLVRFVDDKRGVSAVVGAILMFGILILALTTYQAAIVPQQNAQTEFKHFEDNRDELIEFRNAVSTAGQTRVSQFPNIKLGTQYQSRTFTINPAPPAGTLQTSQPYNITLTDGETTKNVSTRFVEYRPGYREISVGSTWYEHSVLYLDERESSSQNIIEDQNIVTSSGTVRITALQNAYQSSGTGRVSVELYPRNGSEFPEFDGEVTVKIPTRLDGDDYWNEELDDRSVYNNVEPYPDEDDIYRVVLEVNSGDNIEMNTVGIQDEPTEGSVNNVPIRGGGENGGDEETEVNPAGPNDVRLVGISESGTGSDEKVTLTFKNGGEYDEFINGRIGFLYGGPGGGGDPTKVTEVTNATGFTLAEDLEIGGNFVDFNQAVPLPNGEKTEITYEFDDDYDTKQGFFVTTLGFQDGGRATYFIGGEF